MKMLWTAQSVLGFPKTESGPQLMRKSWAHLVNEWLTYPARYLGTCLIFAEHFLLFGHFNVVLNVV